MRAGPAYFEKEKESVEGMIAVVQEYAQGRSDDVKAINDPLFTLRDIVEKRTPGKDVSPRETMAVKGFFSTTIVCS